MIAHCRPGGQIGPALAEVVLPPLQVVVVLGGESGLFGVVLIVLNSDVELQFDIAIEDYKNDAKEAGFATKYDNYLEWRKYHLSKGRTNLPSGPAVRNHYGSWSKAIGGKVSAGLREFVPPPSDKYFYRD